MKNLHYDTTCRFFLLIPIFYHVFSLSFSITWLRTKEKSVVLLHSYALIQLKSDINVRWLLLILFVLFGFSFVSCGKQDEWCCFVIWSFLFMREDRWYSESCSMLTFGSDENHSHIHFWHEIRYRIRQLSSVYMS